MRRKWISLIAVALMMILIGGDLVEAKRSRSKRGPSRARVAKKNSRVKAGHGRGAKVARGRGGRRGRRGRIARAHRQRDYLPQGNASDLPRQYSGTIPSERVNEIQEALIKMGYLQGPATGQYDDNTSAAMKQFQADNKLAQTGQPSAHTLKRLGVSKTGSDGYSVPVGKVSESEKKPRAPNL